MRLGRDTPIIPAWAVRVKTELPRWSIFDVTILGIHGEPAVVFVGGLDARFHFEICRPTPFWELGSAPAIVSGLFGWWGLKFLA
jgi:hypothetical protein